jgi:hypothetical protein
MGVAIESIIVITKKNLKAGFQSSPLTVSKNSVGFFSKSNNLINDTPFYAM